MNQASQIACARWGVSAPIAVGNDMPPSKAELDKELADFLRGQREAEAEGVSARALHRALLSLDGRIAAHDKEDRDRHNEAMQAIYGLQARMSSAEAEFRAVKSDVDELKPEVRKAHESLHEITEAELEQRVADEQSKRAEAAAKVNRWLGRGAQVAMAVIILIATTCVGYALGKLGLKP